MARLKNPIERPSPLTRRQQQRLEALWAGDDDEALLAFLEALPGGVGALAGHALTRDGRERAGSYVAALLRAA